HLFAFNDGDSADAVPLDLEVPLVAARWTIGDRRLHRRDDLGHGREFRAFQAAEVEPRFFLGAGAVPAVFLGAAARLAGRLLFHSRSVAPAVFFFSLRAGRLRAISSWVRPERTL